MKHVLLVVVVLFILAFIFYKLAKTNMDVPPNAEKRLGPLGRLKFALEHNLPLDRSDAI